MSKLKANELMIGDWVQDITPVVIDAISNEDICTYRTKHGYITANPSNLKPIPLTAEILEKNGFRTFGLIDAPKYGLWLNDGRIIELSRIDNGWRIWVFYNNIPMSLNYLHELQHALRLCGIDKEIVLNE